MKKKMVKRRSKACLPKHLEEKVRAKQELLRTSSTPDLREAEMFHLKRVNASYLQTIRDQDGELQRYKAELDRLMTQNRRTATEVHPMDQYPNPTNGSSPSTPQPTDKRLSEYLILLEQQLNLLTSWTRDAMLRVWEHTGPMGDAKSHWQRQVKREQLKSFLEAGPPTAQPSQRSQHD